MPPRTQTSSAGASVSVVILSHDRAPELERAFLSAVSQTLPPCEVVVVFSGDELPLPDSGIPMRTVRCGSSGGAARNAGADICVGEFIAFLDDDDEWYPNKLGSQVPLMADGTCIVCSPYDIETPEGSTDRFVPSGKGILGENTVGCTSMPLIRTSAFMDAGGFDPDMESNQEWDLWMRLLSSGEVSISGTSVGLKHFSRDCISLDPRRRERGWLRLMMKHAGQYLSDPHQLERALWFFYRDMLFLGRYPMAFAGVIAYGAVRIPLIVSDLAHGIDPDRRSHARA